MHNQVHRVNMSGGIIGIFQDPQKKLQQGLNAMNGNGEELVAILGDEWSAGQQWVSVILLFVTLLIWCPAPGYMIITKPTH